MKLLLNDNRVDINKADKHGETPFCVACENGHLDIVKLFINDNRIDVNQTSDNCQTPFCVACYLGKTEVVKYLLESGREIDINKKDNDGKTGLDWAREKGNTDIVELIESFQKKIEEKKNKFEEEKKKKEESTTSIFFFFFSIKQTE